MGREVSMRISSVVGAIFNLSPKSVDSKQNFLTRLEKISNLKPNVFAQSRERIELLELYKGRHDEILHWVCIVAKDQSASLDYREQAIKILRRINQPGSVVVSHLEELLSDKNEFIRFNAIHALIDQYDHRVTPLLIKHVDDPSKIVQIAAIGALGECTNGGAALKVLNRKLSEVNVNDPTTKLSINEAIENITKKAIAKTAHLLRDLTHQLGIDTDKGRRIEDSRRIFLEIYKKEYGEDIIVQILAQIASGFTKDANNIRLEAMHVLKELGNGNKAIEALINALEKNRN